MNTNQPIPPQTTIWKTKLGLKRRLCDLTDAEITQETRSLSRQIARAMREHREFSRLTGDTLYTADQWVEFCQRFAHRHTQSLIKEAMRRGIDLNSINSPPAKPEKPATPAKAAPIRPRRIRL